MNEAARLDNPCLVKSLLDTGCSKKEHFTTILRGTPLQEYDNKMSFFQINLETKFLKNIENYKAVA